MSPFNINEQLTSQLPALELLIKSGYTFLSREEAERLRFGKLSEVILEPILRERLKAINSIQFKGRSYLFSEENIQTAIERIKTIRYDGWQNTNESVYDFLTLGMSLEQTLEGDSRSYPFQFINWNQPSQNVFHVSPEFSVERNRSTETARPDLVLFVNGIPFCVIECKSPTISVDTGVEQMLRNQGERYISRLFHYTQLLISTNKNELKYGTTGTPKKFWAVWKELEDKDEAIQRCLQKPLSTEVKDYVFSEEFEKLRNQFEQLERQSTRELSIQDRNLYSLCRPERLLEFAYKFIVFDAGVKKIARYQQYFVVKSTLQRIKQYDEEGRRKGGIIWHTQGSGKSLTMVMLARNLVMDAAIPNPRVVLVTDRDDLDKQLKNTFIACGLDAQRATSGRNLLELVAVHKASIVTTLVHKFDKALNVRRLEDPSKEIFMLVDESHRTQFGSFSARMRTMFPNACYLGFTGTPLLKKEKNNFSRFGGLVEPHYSIKQAVEDGSVLPLLYESRHVEILQNKEAIDIWFERHTSGLNDEQKADLKRKYARAEMLNKAEQVIYMRAFDIHSHYVRFWQGTGFKAQLVAPSKVAAIQYHQFLQDLGGVTSEVIISAPDMREGFDEIEDESKSAVVRFWDKQMKRFGKEENYTKQIIAQFKESDEPEILIVVDKLITGFDAPRNTVLYLCRALREHTLLQAIARVNRLYEGKEFGYIIDYANILQELDTALTMYSAFEGFDEEDLDGALQSVQVEIKRLPDLHQSVWEIFKKVRHRYDEESFEQVLANEEVRDTFYERLSAFSKCLMIALSSEVFIKQTDSDTIAKYKNDLKRFVMLKEAVKLRYAESISYKDYEPRIKKLLDQHIQAFEVIQLNEPVNIFDEEHFQKVLNEQGQSNKKTASVADTIAHNVKKVILAELGKDPGFFEKFSTLIQKAIDEFKAQRISDLEYLKRVTEIRDQVVSRDKSNYPELIRDNNDIIAAYGVLEQIFSENKINYEAHKQLVAEAASELMSILKKHWKVHFWEDSDAQKRVMNEMDDYMFDELQGKQGLMVSVSIMDSIIQRTLELARNRFKA